MFWKTAVGKAFRAHHYVRGVRIGQTFCGRRKDSANVQLEQLGLIKPVGVGGIGQYFNGETRIIKHCKYGCNWSNFCSVVVDLVQRVCGSSQDWKHFLQGVGGIGQCFYRDRLGQTFFNNVSLVKLSLVVGGIGPACQLEQAGWVKVSSLSGWDWASGSIGEGRIG